MCDLTNAGEPYKSESQGVQTIEGGWGLDANPGLGMRGGLATSLLPSPAVRSSGHSRQPSAARSHSLPCSQKESAGGGADWHAVRRTLAARERRTHEGGG